MKSEDLVAIIDFLYYGEANIDHANLDTFLNIVEELQLKGLNIEKGDEHEEDNYLPMQTLTATQESSVDYQLYHKSQIGLNMAVTKQEFSGNIQTLNEEIETMIGRGEKLVKCGSRLRNGEWRMGKSYVCQVCGKEGKRTHITTHIEANHLNAIIIPCTVCKKTFRTRDSLRHHDSLCHKDKNNSFDGTVLV